MDDWKLECLKADNYTEGRGKIEIMRKKRNNNYMNTEKFIQKEKRNTLNALE